VRDDAFERLFRAYAQDLVGFLAYRTGSDAEAEDLAAAAFERAYRARRRFDPRRGSEKTWLYRIAVNLLLDRSRRLAAERRAVERASHALSAGSSGTDLLDAVLDRDRIRVALSSLSEEEQVAIALRYGGDLRLAEVAKVVGASRAATEKRIYRGLEKLALELDGSGSVGSAP
jgi:RNA polymerase sigma factor (sigma-70 family)